MKKKFAGYLNISDTDAYNLGLDTLIERSIGTFIKDERENGGSNGELQKTFQEYLELKDREIQEEIQKRDLVKSYIQVIAIESQKVEEEQQKLKKALARYNPSDLQYISSRLKRAKFNPDLIPDSEKILTELEAHTGTRLNSEIVLDAIASMEAGS